MPPANAVKDRQRRLGWPDYVGGPKGRSRPVSYNAIHESIRHWMGANGLVTREILLQSGAWDAFVACTLHDPNFPPHVPAGQGIPEVGIPRPTNPQPWTETQRQDIWWLISEVGKASCYP